MSAAQDIMRGQTSNGCRKGRNAERDKDIKKKNFSSQTKPTLLLCHDQIGGYKFYNNARDFLLNFQWVYIYKKKYPYHRIIQPLVILPQCLGTENNK